MGVRWRLIISLAVLFSAWFMLCQYTGHERAGSYFTGKQNQSWELDLKGGIHLTLGVEVAKAVSNSLAITGQDIPPACPGKQDCRPEAESSWRNNPGIYSAKGRKRKAAPGGS